jgi:hypothetical protein
MLSAHLLRCSLLITTLALLCACGGPRAPITSREQALHDQRRLDVRIVHVHDTLSLPYQTETSHLIEVKVLGGADAAQVRDLKGRVITLPYDEWMVGAPPPRNGKRMNIAPADWVRRSTTSHGKPADGWTKVK